MVDKIKPKILIAEDDLSSQQYYSIILEDLYDLTIVSTVIDAKELLKKNDYQIAIIDISLPGEGNGIDLIQYVKARKKEYPICIALTAHAFPHTRISALEAGAAEFFTKPIMSEALIASIEGHLKSLKSG